MVLGGLFGSFVQGLIEPQQPVVMGFVIGGLVFFGLSEAMKD